MGTKFKNTYEEVQTSSYVLYAYVEKRSNDVVYIGIDSNGDKNRRKICHESPSWAGKQLINKIIQLHPDWYEYQVIAIAADLDWMQDMEMALIKTFKDIGQAKFNWDNPLEDE